MISRIVGITAGFVLSLPLLKSPFFHLLCSDQIRLFFLKLVVNKTDMEAQVKQDKSEAHNCTQPNLSTACVNDCTKVKLHELVRSLLKFIYLGMYFSDH